MFPKQIEVLDALPEVRKLLAKHQYQGGWLDGIESQSRNFIVRVPFVGAFSSGKSTLLNSLIGGEPLLATSIDPETAVPTELVYAPEERLVGCLPDGKRIPVSRDEVKENRLEALFPNGWVEAQLPSESLAQLSHLRLVDMPGWDSGNERHAQAIDSYVSRSLAYCVVVSAEAGCLNESIRNALIELRVHATPVVAIISKCDKKPVEDIAAVAEEISSEIAEVLGKPPLRVVTVSGRKNQLAEFKAALRTLEQQTEPLFSQHVIKPVCTELRMFSQYLGTLINGDDLDSEKIALEHERIASEMQEFDKRLLKETQQMEGRLPSVLANILNRLQASLTAQLDALARQAQSGRDMQGSLDQTVRLSVSQGIQEEFEPELQRYFSNVGSLLPKDYSTDLPSFKDQAIRTEDDSGSNFLKGAIVTGLTLILKKHPIGIILLPILGPLSELLGGLFKNKGTREAEEAQRSEEARQQILGNIIPRVLQSTEGALQKILSDHVQEARKGISAGLQKQRAILEDALNKLTVELARGKEAFEAARKLHQADMETVQAMLLRLEAA